MNTVIDRRILTTIEALYDAVTDTRKWENVLKEMAELLDADIAHIGHFDHDNPLFNVSLLYGVEGKLHWNAELQQKFERLIPEDPRLILCNTYPEKPISCRMYLTDADLHNSRMWQEVLRYSRAEYSLIVTLQGNKQETLTGVGVFRTPEGRPFDQEACDMMGELVPHFKRALSLHKQLATMDLGQRMSMSTLDHIPMGIFIVASEGRIHFVNDFGKKIARGNDGLLIDFGHLVLRRSEENGELQRLIHAAVDTSKRAMDFPASPQTLSVTRTSAEEPLWAMVSPLMAGGTSLGVGSLQQPMAVVFVSDPLQPQEAPPELLQRLFGLTRREAALVEQLVLGRSLQEGADTLGITEHTARTHLKAAFGKTQTQRQGDLVRLVLSSPVWIRKVVSRTDAQKSIQNTLTSGDRFRLYR
ncbi:MAG: helix-turn-helix transcriptional regulator [Magnetococcales bacterium]|nr:helix-turn-helix transcriptional regulator [Magnetococcales bacterium]